MQQILCSFLLSTELLKIISSFRFLWPFYIVRLLVEQYYHHVQHTKTDALMQIITIIMAICIVVLMVCCFHPSSLSSSPRYTQHTYPYILSINTRYSGAVSHSIMLSSILPLLYSCSMQIVFFLFFFALFLLFKARDH